MKKRATRFIIRVIKVTLVLILAGIVFYAIQLLFHPFDPQIAVLNSYISKINGRLSEQVLSGISFGTLALVLLVTFVPFFIKGIHKKSYWKSIGRGLISAFVFFISTNIYEYAEKISRFYLLIAIIVVIAITFVLIEALSLLMRDEEEVAFRTEIFASIVSGLLFGVLLKLAMMGIQYLKKLV